MAGRERRDRVGAVEGVAADEVGGAVEEAELAAAPGVDLALDHEAALRGHGQADVAVDGVGLARGRGGVEDLDDLAVGDHVDDLEGEVGLDVEARLGGAGLGDARALQGLAGDGADHAVAAEAVDLLEGDDRVVGLGAELAVGLLDLVAELVEAALERLDLGALRAGAEPGRRGRLRLGGGRGLGGRRRLGGRGRGGGGGGRRGRRRRRGGRGGRALGGLGGIVRAGVAGRQDQDRGQPGRDHDGRASPVACHAPTSGLPGSAVPTSGTSRTVPAPSRPGNGSGQPALGVARSTMAARSRPLGRVPNAAPRSPATREAQKASATAGWP